MSGLLVGKKNVVPIAILHSSRLLCWMANWKGCGTLHNVRKRTGTTTDVHVIFRGHMALSVGVATLIRILNGSARATKDLGLTEGSFTDIVLHTTINASERDIFPEESLISTLSQTMYILMGVWVLCYQDKLNISPSFRSLFLEKNPFRKHLIIPLLILFILDSFINTSGHDCPGNCSDFERGITIIIN